MDKVSVRVQPFLLEEENIMITIDPLDDDLPKRDKSAHIERKNKPGKGKWSPQADRSRAHKRGGLLGILARLLRRNTRES